MYKKLGEIINKSKSIIALTGNGISVKSGVPDLYSSDALYFIEKYKNYKIEELLSLQMLEKNPELVLTFYKDWAKKVNEKEPNESHKMLRQLEEMGKLTWIITQNVDNLHKKAGSKHVIELFGNVTQWRCSEQCGEIYTFDTAYKMLNIDSKPECTRCKNGYIRPDIVLYGEDIEECTDYIVRKEIQECDLTITMGNSLENSIISELIHAIPSTNSLVIINENNTLLDHRADLVFNESCEEALKNIIELF